MMTNDERLILMMIEEIKELNKELIGAKYLINNNCPFIKCDSSFKAIKPSFISSKEYKDLTRRFKHDFFIEDDLYQKEIEQLIRNGYSKTGYPKTIHD